MMRAEIGAVVLAAGLSRRMGQPKLLLPWGERSVIEHVVNVLSGAGIGEIVVVIGEAHALVRDELLNSRARLVQNPDDHHGDMLRSLQTGLRSLRDTCAAALIALGDQPQIEASVVESIVRRATETDSSLIVPSYQMRRGHPWLVRRGLWPALLGMDADTQSARDFLQRHANQIDYVTVDTPSILADLDTPEDYQRQRPRAGAARPLEYNRAGKPMTERKRSVNPTAIWQVTSDSPQHIRAISLAQPAFGLDAASRLIPGGAYTTFRTFSGSRMIRFAAHMERLEETARLAGAVVRLDRDQVRYALREAVRQFPSPEKRVRLTLDLEQQIGQVYIAIEPLKVPAKTDYTEGVRAVTRRAHRENPKAKLTNFIATAGEIRQEIPEGINEALMVAEDGSVLEGLSSNFFAFREGALFTAEEGVLSGLTRRLVLEEARAEGIRVVLQPVLAASLATISEALITSASRAVLPVVQIDGRPVGDGRPGPLTLRLLERYEARIQAESEEI